MSQSEAQERPDNDDDEGNGVDGDDGDGVDGDDDDDDDDGDDDDDDDDDAHDDDDDDDEDDDDDDDDDGDDGKIWSRLPFENELVSEFENPAKMPDFDPSSTDHNSGPRPPILGFHTTFGIVRPSPSILEHPQPLSRLNERAIRGGGNGF